jgi:hypothetical protein
MRRLVLPVLLALAVAGCRAEASEELEDWEKTEVRPCSSAAATDAAVLDAAAILAEHPAGADLVDQAATCDDLGAANAYRFYRSDLGAEEVAAFYRGIAQQQGWTMFQLDAELDPAVPCSLDFLCAEVPVAGKPAYLELWWPDDDSNLFDEPAGKVSSLDLSREPRVRDSCSNPMAGPRS